MSVTRWDPFRDVMTLREAMANLMEDSYVAPRGASIQMNNGGGNLALDVHETTNEYVVTAALPGVAPEDVDINVLGNTVRIHGEFKPQEPTTAGESTQAQQTQEQNGQTQATQANGSNVRQGRWIMRERRYGSFERVVTLPTAVKAEQGQAHFENGVLTLTLPKVEEAKPRAIKINARSAVAGTATEYAASTSQQG